MDTNFSLRNYIWSHLIRGLMSTTILCASIVGLAIIQGNYTGNDYKLKSGNKSLMTVLFVITGALEAASVFLNVYFFRRQR